MDDDDAINDVVDGTDLSGVGELQHGAGLLLARVLQDDDGVLAGRCLQDVPEVAGHGGEDDFVCVQRRPVGTRQGDVHKVLRQRVRSASWEPHITIPNNTSINGAIIIQRHHHHHPHHHHPHPHHHPDHAHLADVEVPEGGGHIEVEVVPAEAVLLAGRHPGAPATLKQAPCSGARAGGRRGPRGPHSHSGHS